MLDIITNTNDAIKEAKSKKNMGKTISVLLVAAIIFAIAAAIMTYTIMSFIPFESIPGIPIQNIGGWGAVEAGIGMFLTIFIGGLFFGFIVKLAMKTLGEKGTYYEGLTTLSYPIFIFSVGALISAIFSFVPILRVRKPIN